MPEDDKECDSLTVTSVGPFLVCGNKYYLQVYLDNWAFKTANQQMTSYLDDNLFEEWILEIRYYNRIDKK